MNTTWYELNVLVIVSVAQLTLGLTVLIYLLSLPAKNLEAKLFAGYLLATCLFYTMQTLNNLVVSLSFKGLMYGLSNIILGIALLFYVGFAYQCGGNPYKRESLLVILIVSLMLGGAFCLSDLDAIYITYPHIAGTLWVVLIYGRKASRAESKSDWPTPSKKVLRGFQKLAFLTFLIWVSVAFLPPVIHWGLTPFMLSYFVIPPLILFQITYAGIVFLNYTPHRTSFQAKVVGLVLCPLLIILALTPIVLRQLVVDLPNFDLVNYRLSAAFLILIPLTTLAVVVGLQRFLRSNLLSPLHQILEGVRQVDAGNLMVQVPVEVRDEIGDLAQNFNQMTRSLRQSKEELTQYAENLETKVVERTQELKQSLDNLKATQSQLIQKEKMASLGELTAGIAHEIQNPLNFVNNFAEVSAELAEELQESAKSQNMEAVIDLSSYLRDNMGYIAENGQRASAIVRSMLEHSRSSSDERRPTDLNALADEYLRLAYNGMRRSEGRTPGDPARDPDFQVQLITDFENTLPPVEVAPQEIGRVLLNLCNNAFYAVREKQYKQVAVAGVADEGTYQPTVWISTRRVQGQVELSVKDNGNGIPEEIISKIFQPFFTTKPTGEGTGLGLSLSYDIVTKGHGGEIKVESREGEGTVFTMSLPQQLTTLHT
ncbi:sensor histidine kinase [Dyadobacter pollutisoli]|uniref:histidine kinase n=1 Tax=Dyadobacter pollutisoli TaxID=2910158 RepID=A0A9E8SQT1_9BACT|nr:ATP-binding protein [Dyadobacter pollutisoli]WAC13397.1 ATP-binding protein [Dyadobacter pollutisoli]